MTLENKIAHLMINLYDFYKAVAAVSENSLLINEKFIPDWKSEPRITNMSKNDTTQNNKSAWNDKFKPEW